MKGLLMWIVGVAIGVTVMTPLAILSVESRPVGEWMGIAFFLLCQLLPFNVVMLVTCLAIYRHIQARIPRANSKTVSQIDPRLAPLPGRDARTIYENHIRAIERGDFEGLKRTNEGEE